MRRNVVSWGMSSRSLLSKLTAGLLLGSAFLANATEPFRLLTVGNSFADDATSFFPKLAKAGGKDVVIYKANLGGHSLKQHAGYLKAFLADPADPKGRPYPALGESKEKASLPEALKSQRWDAVTVQQYSLKSPDASTYEPFATELVTEIHKDAPQAKIYVQQTWAYREDSGNYKDGKTQQTMYEGLKAAYETMAKNHELTILPVGTAFQNARATENWKFVYPDPAFDYKNPPADAVPVQKGSLNVGWKWGKDKEGNVKFALDANHANVAGRYLAGCVWYEVLFGESVLDNSFVPEGLTPEQAAELRKIAHDTVAAQK